MFSGGRTFAVDAVGEELEASTAAAGEARRRVVARVLAHVLRTLVDVCSKQQHTSPSQANNNTRLRHASKQQHMRPSHQQATQLFVNHAAVRYMATHPHSCCCSCPSGSTWTLTHTAAAVHVPAVVHGALADERAHGVLAAALHLELHAAHVARVEHRK